MYIGHNPSSPIVPVTITIVGFLSFTTQKTDVSRRHAVIPSDPPVTVDSRRYRCILHWRLYIIHLFVKIQSY